MKKILAFLLVSTIWSASWGAVATSIVGAKSDDWGALNPNVTTFGGAWLTGPDSTGTSLPVGKSGGTYYYVRSTRFPGLTIPQGSTIDSAELWMVSGGSSCGSAGNCNSAQIKLRVAIYNADNGTQVVDTDDFRTAWAAKATSTGSMDTGLVTATWTSLNVKYRLPFNKLDSVIQTATNRAGWTSGNSITLMVVPTADCVDSARLTKNYDNTTVGNFYDSLWVSYSAASGGGGGATPNTVLRGATVRGSIIRAPEKMFRREESWKW